MISHHRPYDRRPMAQLLSPAVLHGLSRGVPFAIFIMQKGGEKAPRPSCCITTGYLLSYAGSMYFLKALSIIVTQRYMPITPATIHIQLIHMPMPIEISRLPTVPNKQALSML